MKVLHREEGISDKNLVRENGHFGKERKERRSGKFFKRGPKVKIFQAQKNEGATWERKKRGGGASLPRGGSKEHVHK